MKKIPCLIVRDHKSKIIPPIEEMEINEGCEWVMNGRGIATIKWDGTACAIINGQKYARFDAKINKKTGKRKEIPAGAIECCPPDPITKHWPHWVPANKPEHKYILEAFANTFTEDEISKIDYATFEAVGPKINNNPQKLDKHEVLEHGEHVISGEYFLDKAHNRTLLYIRDFLEVSNYEGIVFHAFIDDVHTMAKIRRVDFGLKWPK